MDIEEKNPFVGLDNNGRVVVKNRAYRRKRKTTADRPDRINYCAQIEAPANGLQPITWVKDSWKDLEESLLRAEKGLDQEAVEKAWHEAEIQRAKALIKYHEEALKSDES